MAKYYLGIDETGSFDIMNPTGSFVCGVLTRLSQKELDSTYVDIYNEIKNPKLESIDDILPNIHWTEMNKRGEKHQQERLIETFYPKIERLYRTLGKPTGTWDIQDFWSKAVEDIIQNAILDIESKASTDEFGEQIKLTVFIDQRDPKVWKTEITKTKFEEYHENMQLGLAERIKQVLPHIRWPFDLMFSSDDKNSYINMADVFCGALRDKRFKNKIDATVCSFENVQLQKVHTALDDLEKENNQLKKDNTNLLLEKQKVDQLGAIIEENQERGVKIQEEIDQIREEKEALENDLSKSKAEKTELKAELQKREENQRKKEEEHNKSWEETQKRIEELLQRVEKLESAPSPDISDKEIQTSNSLFKRKEIKMKSIDVEEESMDDDQLDLIESTIDKSMLVSGSAGSGKSVIAMHKAQQILEMGGNAIVISYTKSLCEFMEQGELISKFNNRFYYYHQWKRAGMPSADYVIVDEIQDFSGEEIQKFIKAARKSYFFFGDTAQSIYDGLKKTLSIEEISKITGLNPLMLYKNYRLPKSVAKITQEYVGIGVNRYSEAIYKSEETNLPHIVHIETLEAQAQAIIKIVRKQRDKSIGILVPENKIIQDFMDIFYAESFLCEAKYTDGDTSRFTLDFNTKSPKLMTFHSAKGLQFGTVIIPMFNGATSINNKKALYVAMTRTYRDLFILYEGALQSPLKEVDKSLYLRTL